MKYVAENAIAGASITWPQTIIVSQNLSRSVLLCSATTQPTLTFSHILFASSEAKRPIFQ